MQAVLVPLLLATGSPDRRSGRRPSCRAYRDARRRSRGTSRPARPGRARGAHRGSVDRPWRPAGEQRTAPTSSAASAPTSEEDATRAGILSPPIVADWQEHAPFSVEVETRADRRIMPALRVVGPSPERERGITFGGLVEDRPRSAELSLFPELEPERHRVPFAGDRRRRRRATAFQRERRPHRGPPDRPRRALPDRRPQARPATDRA